MEQKAKRPTIRGPVSSGCPLVVTMVMATTLTIITPGIAEAKRKKSSRTKVVKKRRRLQKKARGRWDYRLRVMGGARDEQVATPDVLVDTQLGARYRWRRHSVGAFAGYRRDPYSTKTFNFANDEGEDQRNRIVQLIDEAHAGLWWRGRTSKTVHFDTRLAGGYRWAERRSDSRFHLSLTTALRLGRKRGFQYRFTPRLSLKWFPQYRVADRRLDRLSAGSTSSVGYRFRKGQIWAGYRLRYTPYFDARYDTIVDDETFVRAETSKSLLNHQLESTVSLRPSKSIQIRLQYRYDINDSLDYDRRMNGRDEDGETESRFFVGYYDFDRHRVDAALTWRPHRRWRFNLGMGAGIRSFDTYEARDAENRWLDELRTDTFGYGRIEARYRIWRFKSHRLYAIASGRHNRHASNMTREVSFATNYALTRIYVGLQLSGR